MSGTSVRRMTSPYFLYGLQIGAKAAVHRDFSSIIAAMGRQLKQSVNVFHNLMLYRRLPE